MLSTSRFASTSAALAAWIWGRVHGVPGGPLDLLKSIEGSIQGGVDLPQHTADPVVQDHLRTNRRHNFTTF